jgi:pimeloyl-ACP methyl ester carboxylesterase
MKRLRAGIFSATACLLAFSWGSAASQTASSAPPVKHATVNGIDVVFLEQGQGTAVVFVHSSFGDHRTWEGQREAVASRYRYVALSQRYFGTAPWPDSGEKYSVATHVDDLAAFIRELKAGPIHLVGWSYGGTIALTLAVRHPELLKSLFLYEPVGLLSIVTDPAEAKAAAEDTRAILGPAAGANKAGDTAGVVRLFFDGVNGQSGIFETLSPGVQSIFLDNARTAPLFFGAPPAVGPSCIELGQITVPVAVAKGEQTRVFYRILVDAVSRCIPGSSVVIVSHGRHSAPALTPAAFNDALIEFLRDK